MQKPKNKLKQGQWYQVAAKTILHQTKSIHSNPMMKIEPDSMVMFLEYHPGSVRSCKVMYQELVGWIVVDPKYKDHLHFFKRVSLQC